MATNVLEKTQTLSGNENPGNIDELADEFFVEATQEPNETYYAMQFGEPKVGVISKNEAEHILTPQVIELVDASLRVGDSMYFKGSSIGVFSVKGFPVTSDGYRHPERSSDIDVYPGDEEIRTAFLNACGRAATRQRSATNYSGRNTFTLKNDIKLDVNNIEALRTSLSRSLENLYLAIQNHIDDPKSDSPPWESELLDDVSERISQLESAYFDPMDLLSQNGFMPLDSLVLKVTKLVDPIEDGEAPKERFVFEILDEYNMIGMNKVREQKLAQAQQGKFLGTVFSQESMAYSPYFMAMAFAALIDPEDPVYMDDPTFLLHMYSDVYKLHTDFVEGNVSIDMQYGSPINNMIQALRKGELPIRPKSKHEYQELLEQLKAKAQKEFCRAVASDAPSAVNAFLVTCRAGNQIYPNFERLFPADDAEFTYYDQLMTKIDRRHFSERFNKIKRAMYPVKKIETISTIAQVSGEPGPMFENEKSPHSINEVFAWLMVSDGLTAETAEEVIEETAKNWVQKGAITSGWFFGDTTTFNMDFHKDDILGFMEIFEKALLIEDLVEEDSENEDSAQLERA